MESVLEFLNNIWDYISSAEVLGTISFSSILAFIIQFFTKSWQLRKANAKYGAKADELEKIKQVYDKYITKADETVKELSQQYVAMANLVKELHQNAINQNEALRTAFNSSNLVTSAKREVEKILLELKTPVAEVEIQKDTPTPISNAVNEVVENEVVENEQQKIVRIK